MQEFQQIKIQSSSNLFHNLLFQIVPLTKFLERLGYTFALCPRG